TSSGDRKGYFGAATKNAVKRFYQHLGYDVPTTGGPNDDGDKSRLLGAQGAVDAAQRALDDFDRAQRASPAPGQEPASVQRGYLTKALDQAKTAQSDVVATTGTMFP